MAKSAANKKQNKYYKTKPNINVHLSLEKMWFYGVFGYGQAAWKSESHTVTNKTNQ